VLFGSDCSCSANNSNVDVPFEADMPQGASMVMSTISRPVRSFRLAMTSHAIRMGRGNRLLDRTPSQRTGAFSTITHSAPNLSVNRHSTNPGKSSETHLEISARIYVVTTIPLLRQSPFAVLFHIRLSSGCRLLAHSRRSPRRRECPVSGVERTQAQSSATRPLFTQIGPQSFCRLGNAKCWLDRPSMRSFV
jgi:hypothetical protein